MRSDKRSYILLYIVLAQFCCTSLWFAGNAVLLDLIQNFVLHETVLGHLTSSVQLGFISGTLTFAILTIADRFSPSKVFLYSAILGALCNLGLLWSGNGLKSILIFRCFTGFFLAGIYPVGMKIAADYFEQGLGKSLGFLVGALVLGTAFPHLLNNISEFIGWQTVIKLTSILSAFGGLIMWLMVPDGPNRRGGQIIDFSAFLLVFKNKTFRSAAFGYFGHMWELYAFWAFVPVILSNYFLIHPAANYDISLLSFAIIGIGALACVLAGYLARTLGEKQVAQQSLLLSALCCICAPFILQTNAPFLVLSFLFFWGIVVIADSPMFSTLVAQNATPKIKGTAITIVNCIGFSITIVSIQLLNVLVNTFNTLWVYLVLAIGPLLGLMALRSADGDNQM